MKTAKDVALIGMYTALLIGGQFAFSGISGVEIVTVLLIAFSYYFGIVRGLFAANAFSLLRCFVFGFFPNVIILYLIYYNLFVILFGLLGRKFKRQLNAKSHVVLIFSAVCMTIFFTALDDLVTPLYYGFSSGAMKAYAVASLAAVVLQTVCAAVTTALILPVLHRVFKVVNSR